MARAEREDEDVRTDLDGADREGVVRGVAGREERDREMLRGRVELEGVGSGGLGKASGGKRQLGTASRASGEDRK